MSDAPKTMGEAMDRAMESFLALPEVPVADRVPFAYTPQISRRSSLLALSWPSGTLDEAAVADCSTPAIVRASTWNEAEHSAIVLSGPQGTGKTVAAAHWCLSRQVRMQFVRASTFARSSRYDATQSALWYGSDALCLDDLGAEYLDGKGSFLVDLDELIDTYYADRRPLIITTNLDANGFKARYGARIEDRIRECALWLTVAGPSLRRAP